MREYYETYKTEDFLNDDFFIEWVKDETPAACLFWEEWMSASPANLGLMKDARIRLHAILSADRMIPARDDAGMVWEKIASSIKEEQVPVVSMHLKAKVWTSRKWWTAAAAVLLMAGSLWYVLGQREGEGGQPVGHNTSVGNVLPGGNKAVLTLGDGTVVLLDSARNGMITQQGGVAVIKLEDGEIAYRGSGERDEISYNTISTPVGGQYHLTLGDGTRVWLNAASSLRYPTTFSGKERRVELQGEGYFEVAHSVDPFMVTAGNMEVQVLGTHFNINAYENEEAIAATLLEGKVKVSGAGKFVVLHPNEQARFEGENLEVRSGVEAGEIIAWKNGYFSFNGASIQSVMRQLARWYDIEVVFAGKLPTRRFGGEMQRDLELSQVLKILEKNKVHFKQEGKKVIVNP